MGTRSKQGKKRAQPQHSFQDLVAQATLEKFGPFIQGMVSQLGQRLAKAQSQAQQTLYTRLLVLEEVATEKLGVTKDELAQKVAQKEDAAEGFETAEVVEKGDRVRVSLRTKQKDAKEFQGESRHLVDNVASGDTFGEELEEAMLGLKAGELKEVTLKETGDVIEVTLNMVSRKPKKEVKAEETKEAEKTA